MKVSTDKVTDCLCIGCSGAFWVVTLKFDGTGLVWFALGVAQCKRIRKVTLQCLEIPC